MKLRHDTKFQRYDFAYEVPELAAAYLLWLKQQEEDALDGLNDHIRGTYDAGVEERWGLLQYDIDNALRVIYIDRMVDLPAGDTRHHWLRVGAPYVVAEEKKHRITKLGDDSERPYDWEADKTRSYLPYVLHHTSPRFNPATGMIEVLSLSLHTQDHAPGFCAGDVLGLVGQGVVGVSSRRKTRPDREGGRPWTDAWITADASGRVQAKGGMPRSLMVAARYEALPIASRAGRPGY
ncbi:MAG: hypothetical protein AAF288_08790 [Planctomycetota bacterium]